MARQGDDDQDYNNTYAIDGRWGIGDEITVSGYLAQTETPGRRGDDQAAVCGLVGIPRLGLIMWLTRGWVRISIQKSGFCDAPIMKNSTL